MLPQTTSANPVQALHFREAGVPAELVCCVVLSVCMALTS